MILCLNTPIATACTSSISGDNLLFITAKVLAASIRFCEALGPAPQSTYCLTIELEPMESW